MSRESVAVVRDALSAWSESDPQFTGHWATDCEFVTFTAGQIEGMAYRGHDGLRRYAQDRLEAWEELRFEANEYMELGEHVVVVGVLSGRGRGSGVPVHQPVAVACELRGGKLLRVHAYPDVEQALAAIAPG